MATDSLDASWRPNATVRIAKERASMMRDIQQFFAQRDVLQVDTPVLGINTVTDPNIESIATTTETESTMFLQTSPEYFMKRLLAAGYPDIYQVCKVFRASESGRTHLPEFSMVEWYRQDFSLRQIMEETVALIGRVLGQILIELKADYLSYTDAFQKFVGVDPLLCDVESLKRALHADDVLRASLGDDRSSWLDLAMSQLLAPKFSGDRLTVLHHYPASQAALARRCPDDDSLADRFEVFFAELELANGFVELTDADEQLARFHRDRQTRSGSGRAVPEVDDNLIAALRDGVPQCAGVAVGFERMLMIKAGCCDINDVVSFSFEDRPND